MKFISASWASGDNGAFDCWARDPSDQRETVDYPSASPYTIAVGGTHLNVRADGTYLSESGWESYLSTAGTGGGINRIDKQPVWQVAPGVKNALSNGKRQSPDVAAAGDPETGYVVWFTEPGQSEGSWMQIGGTSAAAPFSTVTRMVSLLYRSWIDASSPLPEKSFGIPKIPNRNTTMVATTSPSFQVKVLFMS
jgi:subtilase family serine protease